MNKVLVTGMSGLIGGLLRQHLESEGGYELSALNRRAVEGVRCFQADIGAPDDLKYDVFLATSNNKWSYRDLSHAREVLGYVPQDSADDYR